MIVLTKVDGNQITVNSDEIELIESRYDTIIQLKSGRKIIVKENSEEIIKKVINFRQKCFEKIIIDTNIEISQ